MSPTGTVFTSVKTRQKARTIDCAEGCCRSKLFSRPMADRWRRSGGALTNGHSVVATKRTYLRCGGSMAVISHRALCGRNNTLSEPRVRTVETREGLPEQVDRRHAASGESRAEIPKWRNTREGFDKATRCNNEGNSRLGEVVARCFVYRIKNAHWSSNKYIFKFKRCVLWEQIVFKQLNEYCVTDQIWFPRAIYSLSFETTLSKPTSNSVVRSRHLFDTLSPPLGYILRTK